MVRRVHVKPPSQMFRNGGELEDVRLLEIHLRGVIVTFQRGLMMLPGPAGLTYPDAGAQNALGSCCTASGTGCRYSTDAFSQVILRISSAGRSPNSSSMTDCVRGHVESQWG
jgi:hypothetical protein